MKTGSLISKTIRGACLLIWLAVLVVGVGSYIREPDAFTPQSIADFMQRFGGLIWLVYLAVSALRGFTLLPSTPLVLAGTLLFPEQPVAVFVVAMAGIIVSSTMIYFFSDKFGFHDYFESHKPQLTHRIKAKLEHPLGVVVVALWAFFPLVPTDLVCYVAGTTEMSYTKFIIGVVAGETILCVFYIFLGGSIVQYFR